jgi:hypothetical protein
MIMIVKEFLTRISQSFTLYLQYFTTWKKHFQKGESDGIS